MQISIISGTKKDYFENGVKAKAEEILVEGWAVHKVSNEHNISPSNVL
jgi:hypothetical protein